MKTSDDLYKIKIDLNKCDISKTSAIFSALSSPIRLTILKDLQLDQMTLSDIAKKYNLQISSASFHMDTLVKAGLVNTEFGGKQGITKWFSYIAEREIDFVLRSSNESSDTQTFVREEIPIGHFSRIHAKGNSGMATENEIICNLDNKDFFMPDRVKSQIIWIRDGFIEYNIRSSIFSTKSLESVEISLEICSETTGYNENFPSDITFLLNDVELCTYISPGDFGDRYGKLTPSWWYIESTKYGHLVTIKITKSGVILNGKESNSSFTIDNIKEFAKEDFVKFCIKIKDDAKHKGGFNLFGEKFGDYPQAIVFTCKTNK